MRLSLLWSTMALSLGVLGVSVAAQADTASNWTGCYVGGKLAYAWASTSSTLSDTQFSVGSTHPDGASLGGQVGCDYQTGAVVLGGVLSYAGADIKGDHLYELGSSSADRVSYKLKSYGTLAARLGYLVQPQTLAYAQAGFAWANTDFDDNDPSYPVHGSKRLNSSGWLLGLGLEHRLSEHLSFFAEYNYVDLGKKTATLHYDNPIFADQTYQIKQKMNTLGVGLNYRF